MGLLQTNHGRSNFDPVDQMFEALVGHSFKESQEAYRKRRDWFRTPNTTSDLVAHLINNGALNDTKVPSNDASTTTESSRKFMATLMPNLTKTPMYSKKDFLHRRKIRQLEELIKSPSVLQEYLNGVDIDTLTRRFDAIPATRRDRWKHFRPPRKPGKSPEERTGEQRLWRTLWGWPSWAWNYDYPYFMQGWKYELEKNKTIDIMHSIVHEVRYKLVHPQLLKRIYHKNIRYRLGYLFAMLRHLQRQSRLVYHELSTMYDMYVIIYPTIRLLDKIARLGTDIRDVIKLIRQYEYVRKLKEEPHYYDIFPISRIPKWRRAGHQKKKRKNLTLEEINIYKKKIELEKLKLQI